MKYEDALVYLGQFGKYQKIRYALLCLPAGTIAMQIMSLVYVLAVPKHRCAIPDLPNDTFHIQNEAHEASILAFIPFDFETNEFSSCQVFNTSSDPFQSPDNETSTFSKISCERWVYDTSQYSSTIVTDFDVVCEYKTIRSHIQVIFMSGGLVISFILGHISDAFGRKKVFLTAVLVHLVAGVSVAMSQSLTFLVIACFINGMACSAVYIVAFVMGMEIVGAQKRTLAGMLIVIGFGVFVVVVVGLAYCIREWRYLQLVTSLPAIFCLSYYWLVDESPRWLIAKKKYVEVKVLLEKMARTNGTEIPSKVMDWQAIEEIGVEKKKNQVKLWHIARYPRLVIRTLILYLNWFVCTLTYYGLALNVGSLAGSVYLNSFLYGVVESASYVMCIFLLDRVGRKGLFVGCMLTAGIACILAPIARLYSDVSWLSILFATIGKFGMSAAFAVIWMYTAELYPTDIRNSAVSSSSFIGRIGKVISPYIANLGMNISEDMGKIAPFLIFGGGALVSGLLALMLPETKNNSLPESMEEVNAFGRRKSKEAGSVNNIQTEAEELGEMIKAESNDQDISRINI